MSNRKDLYKDKKSRYKYTRGEKEINRALKMQEDELAELKSKSDELETAMLKRDSDIKNCKAEINDLQKQTDALMKKALALANERGLKVPSHLTENHKTIIKPIYTDKPLMTEKKISRSEIPSWEDVMKKTDEKVPDDVNLEDLLSEKEFNYCIEDVKRINDEFARKTKLNKTDIRFLMIAAALQTARWILIQLIMGELGETVNPEDRISSKQGDHEKQKMENDWNNDHDDHENVKSEKYPNWKEIVFGQYKRLDGGKTNGNCPYDAQQNAPEGFDDGGRGNHRVYTLGHDPVLGWIFGTANIMTCTISLSKKFNFGTYRVEYPGGRFGDRILMGTMFYEMIDSIKEDKFRLAAGLFAQYAHLKSDVYTSRGLPVPLIEAFSEELAGKLYSEQYDALCLCKDMAKVGAQAGFSILINMIIGFVHGLFYDEEKDGKRDLYEVRTRKILLISNVIASSLNLAYVGVNAFYGNQSAWKKLDLGGLLVTLYRLFSDIRFITRVKDVYIKEELDKVTREALADLDSMFEDNK